MKKPLFLLSIVCIALLLSACSKSTLNAPSQTTSVPTAPPKPVINLSLAVLGGSIHAFDQKFGANTCCYRNGWTPPHGPYVAVEDDTYNDMTLDETSLHRVALIEIQPPLDGPTAVWSASSVTSICTAYLPPDATYQGSFEETLADMTKGGVMVYDSPLLANSLPPKDFIDRNGQPGKPGTLYVYFDYLPDANHIGSCFLDVRGNDGQRV